FHVTGVQTCALPIFASGRVRPDIVVLGESTNGDICVGHRGRAELIVEIRGRAGHASAPERACNAIDLLPTVLPAIREFAAQLPSSEERRVGKERSSR